MSETIGLLSAPLEPEIGGKQNESEFDEKECLSQLHVKTTERRSRTTRFYTWIVLLSISISSLIMNAVQLRFQFQAEQAANACKLPLSGLEPNVQVDFGDKTAYGDTSDLETLDELWSSVDVHSGIIALSKDLHLGTTDTFPWDASKGIYMLNAYHSLHCLQVIYRFARGSESDINRSQTFEHVIHCLDVLKSEAMCTADDTPLSYNKFQLARKERAPKRVCRDWHKLTEYARKNSACFHRSLPNESTYNTLEEFTFCPPDSPYNSVVESFRKTGK